MMDSTVVIISGKLFSNSILKIICFSKFYLTARMHAYVLQPASLV